MATSGALSTSNDKIKYTITITQNSQNASANTSNVTVSVRFYRTNTGYETYGTGTVYCKINGTTYSAAVTSSQKITNSGIVLFTKTLNISHNSDGSKTLTCSAWISHERVTSSEQSYSQKLTTIATASTATISMTTRELGNSLTVNITRKSSSYTHTISYSWAGGSLTQIASNVGTSYTWTPPLTLANSIPNATSATLTIRLTTYLNGNLIGYAEGGLTVSVPASVKPSISAFTLSEAVDGIAAQFGAYVNGKSKINWSTTAAGVYGSTIKSYSVSIAGQSKMSASGTTGVISTTAGTKTATVTVTDSRGRTNSKTATFTVYDYAAPQINFTVVRALSNGTEDDEGVYLKWGIVCTVSPVNNKNTAKYGLGWKLTSASSYTAIETDISPNTYSVNKSMTLQSPTFSTDNTYIIRFTVTDFFGTITKTIPLPTGKTIFDILGDGSGICFGGVAERGNAAEFKNQHTYLSRYTRLDNGLQKQIRITNQSNTGEAGLLDVGLIQAASTTANDPLKLGLYDWVRACYVWGYYKDVFRLYAGTRLNGWTSICTYEGLGSDFTLNSTDTTELTLKTLVTNGSLTFTSDSGKVVVPSGVNRVKISGSIYAKSGFVSGDKLHFNIYKYVGSTKTVVAAAIINCTGTFFTLSMPPKIISVAAGEKIGLAVKNEIAARGVIGSASTATYLTVEVVDCDA